MLQGPSAHDEDTQVAPAWAKLQTVPQAPQLLASLVRFTSQPSLALPLQLLKLLRQVKLQVLDAQVGVALARAGHTIPQPPQLAVSPETVLISQPFDATPSQLP